MHRPLHPPSHDDHDERIPRGARWQSEYNRHMNPARKRAFTVCSIGSIVRKAREHSTRTDSIFNTIVMAVLECALRAHTVKRREAAERTAKERCTASLSLNSLQFSPTLLPTGTQTASYSDQHRHSAGECSAGSCRAWPGGYTRLLDWDRSPRPLRRA